MVYIGKNLSGVKPFGHFEPLPAGEYEAQLIDVEKRKSKKGDPMLSFTWIITVGEFAGRQIFEVAMLEGKSQQFGDEKLRGIAEAVGHPNPDRVDETDDLLQRPITLTVRQSKRKDTGEIQNAISKYSPLPGVGHDPFASQPMSAPEAPYAAPAPQPNSVVSDIGYNPASMNPASNHAPAGFTPPPQNAQAAQPSGPASQKPPWEN